MNNILEFKNVSYAYHTKQNEIKVLDRISFCVEENMLLGLVGPSGCGKSTILSLISKLIEPEYGSINFKKDIKNFTGYMFQKDELLSWRNVLGNILIGNELNKIKDKNYAIELLKKYGLYEFAKSYPDELSGGMRQRVALIRTLNLKPKLLLLDEPFSALDYQTRLSLVDDVFSIIKREEKTAIFVTHDIPEAVSMCDKILVLTNRPAKIDQEIDLSIFKNIMPTARRKTKEFTDFSDAIYERLKYMEKQNE